MWAMKLPTSGELGRPRALSRRLRGIFEAPLTPPRRAFGRIEPGVGFLIADKLFFHRVPFQPAMIPISQIAQVTDRDRAGADFDVADGTLARADAGEKVLLMIGAFVEFDRKPVGFVIRGHLLRFGFEFAAVDQDFSFVADEQNAAAVAVQ